MKKTFLILIAGMLFCLSGCKEKDWMDWKMQNMAWLEHNKTLPGVITTPTGLQYKVIRQGYEGSTKPDDEKTVVVDYVGTLITGDIFDSGENTDMPVKNLVEGFKEGISHYMRKSGKCILYIPYELAYGEDGQGSKGDRAFVPPYSTLIFEVTLLDVY